LIGEYRTKQILGSSGVLQRLTARWVVSAGMIFARLRYGFDFDQASPREAISQSHTPVLLIHGSADELTPATHSQALAAANRNAVLWLVPDAGHTAAAAVVPDEFRRRVLGWFDSH
jgi:pimeloyl-ACP methyl ester carboxylesterase